MVLLLFFAVQWLVSFLAAIAASLYAAFAGIDFETLREPLSTWQPLSAFLVASLLIFWLLRSSLKDRDIRRAWGLQWASGEECLLGFAGGLVLGVFFVNLAGLISFDSVATGEVGAQATDSIAWFLLALVLAPPVEEMLFRGLLMAGLREVAGPVPTLALVTVAFAAIHLPETINFGPAIAGSIAMALTAGWFRRNGGSLLPSVLVHFGYNLGLASAVAASLWLG